MALLLRRGDGRFSDILLKRQSAKMLRVCLIGFVPRQQETADNRPDIIINSDTLQTSTDRIHAIRNSPFMKLMMATKYLLTWPRYVTAGAGKSY